ncbi:MAG: hypothetical protein FJY83_10160 [Candidatus Aminicenantes bacterium]|nr:hypothetical protein [Candidatus Aminicenantes bacterium]
MSLKERLLPRTAFLKRGAAALFVLVSFCLAAPSCDWMLSCSDPDYPVKCVAHNTCCAKDNFCCPSGLATRCCEKLHDCCATTRGCCPPGTVCVGAACYYVTEKGELVFVQDAELSKDMYGIR